MSTPVDPSGLTPLEQRPQAVTQPEAVEANILLNLINSATVTTNSEYADIRNFKLFALEVLTTASDDFSIQLYGSCAMEQPAAMVAGSALGDAVTASGITFPPLAGVRWCQAQLTNTSTEAVTINLSAIAP